MRTTQRKWLVVAGVVAAAAGALAFGVSAGTLLLVGIALLCPAAMYFGMGGMHQGCGHTGKRDHANSTTQSDAPAARRNMQDREHQKAA